MILFMTSIDIGQEFVNRMRRRPAKTATNAKTSRAMFDDVATKVLPIPKPIDLYNHYMNGVDVADQLRCYYNTQRVCNKTWKPLWHWLLDTTVTNSYKIANTTEERSYAELKKHNAHKQFRTDLVTGLFEHSERLTQPRGPKPGIRSSRLADLINRAPIWEHGTIQKLGNEPGYCVVCIRADCKAVRGKRVMKPLQELSGNSLVRKQRRRRGPRSVFGCKLCGIRLCNNDYCFNEHLRVIG